MNSPPKSELITHLSQFITEARYTRMQNVLARRTRHITVVLEDLYQAHNASAVLRSCDCFGIQDVHIIENTNKFHTNKEIHMGSANWVETIRHNADTNNSKSALQSLKDKGYVIYGTSPHSPEFQLHEIPVDRPMALLFGTEKEGLSEEALSMVDHKVAVPMEGFTESFNISVCAALCLYECRRLLNDSAVDWGLSRNEKEVLMLKWIRKTIRGHQLIEDTFISNWNKSNG